MRSRKSSVSDSVSSGFMREWIAYISIAIGTTVALAALDWVREELRYEEAREVASDHFHGMVVGVRRYGNVENGSLYGARLTSGEVVFVHCVDECKMYW